MVVLLPEQGKTSQLGPGDGSGMNGRQVDKKVTSGASQARSRR